MNINAQFYDIESLSNVFTLANWIPAQNHIDLYMLLDDTCLISNPVSFPEQVLRRICECNPNFPKDGTVTLYDLHTESANQHLFQTFGLCDSYNMNEDLTAQRSSYDPSFRLVCDSDPNYDETVHPYLFGYNSYNYDTSMLAIYGNTVYLKTQADEKPSFVPCTAKTIRQENNVLFSPEFKKNMPSYLTRSWNESIKDYNRPNYRDPRYAIRKNMLMSGRHLDVAKLNEKQSHVGLKRLIGMLGGQILESDKLGQNQDTIRTEDELLDLLAYNVSDVINLDKIIFQHDDYLAQFTLKKTLLATYPELIYEKQANAYKPDIRPGKVRRDRLFIDSSSAQLSTKALCPYGHLKDIPAVSFWYPHPDKAAELGIRPVNVLEESRAFFYRNFTDPALRSAFDVIYNYYKSLEGLNFNDSENYKEDYGINALHANDIADFKPGKKHGPLGNTSLFYFNKDQTPSSCFVNFSVGGIHGAEYNKTLFEDDHKNWQKECELLQKAKMQYPEPTDLRKAKTIHIDDTEYSYKDFLKSGATMKRAEYKDLTDKEPQLFAMKDGKYELTDKYAFTSAVRCDHEDFTSYYPNLLRMMKAFFNPGLKYDRYAEIFDNKTRYGISMKDKSLPENERTHYANMREGTKLVLNSASGAADANFESSIRMNNNIISMRIIGQLFSWRIGQAQTLAGAYVPSTNTDGLYSVMQIPGMSQEECDELNHKILASEAKDIGVEIEPEIMYLISKDTNNRLEMDEKSGKITGASGGSLSCRKGPSPKKSLAHPAILDWAMAEYLICCAMNVKGRSLSKPFDREAGRNILLAAEKQFDDRKYLRMFQNVIASSPGSISYVFGRKTICQLDNEIMDKNITAAPNTTEQPIILQHYNRIFLFKNQTPETMHLYAAVGRAITPATRKKRERDNLRAQIHDPEALQVLNAHGVPKEELGSDKEAAIKKINGIEVTYHAYVENRDLSYLTQAEIDYIKENLDLENYLDQLESSFENSWRNHMPGEKTQPSESDTADKTPAKTKTQPKQKTKKPEKTEPKPDPIPVPPLGTLPAAPVSLSKYTMHALQSACGELLLAQNAIRALKNPKLDAVATLPDETIDDILSDMQRLDNKLKALLSAPEPATEEIHHEQT